MVSSIEASVLAYLPPRDPYGVASYLQEHVALDIRVFSDLGLEHKKRFINGLCLPQLPVPLVGLGEWEHLPLFAGVRLWRGRIEADPERPVPRFFGVWSDLSPAQREYFLCIQQPVGSCNVG